MISLARFTRVVEIDIERGEIVVEPGVVNLDVTAASRRRALLCARPVIQQVCTIGGNVAENSGGAHCLKYGFTVNHVLAADRRAARRRAASSSSVWDEGPDLLGGVHRLGGDARDRDELRLRVLRAPEAVRTLLAGFVTPTRRARRCPT